MKIIQLISRSDTIGGSQIHVLDIAKALVESGDDVVVVSGKRGPFTDLLEDNKIKTISIDSFRSEPSLFNISNDFKTAKVLKKILRSENADLIACHSSKAGLIGRVVAKQLKLPSVYTLHGLNFNPNIKFLKRIFAWSIEMVCRPFTDQIIAVSAYDGALAVRSYIANMNQVHTIPNSVRDIGKIPFSFDSITNILMIARFDNQKDHKLLLKALSEIRNKKWVLHLLGDGPLTENIKMLSAELGISDRVEFHGLVADVKPYLERSHVLALTSNYEGLPLAILEAMSCGLPVVASDVGGVSEAVVDNYNGFLIPQNEIATLTKKLEILIGNEEILQQMGECSRLHYEEKFSFDKFSKATTELYRSMVNR